MLMSNIFVICAQQITYCTYIMQTKNMASIYVEYLLINRVSRCPVLNRTLQFWGDLSG